jgi:tetratricopeptide (TPR) repeat protein
LHGKEGPVDSCYSPRLITEPKTSHIQIHIATFLKDYDTALKIEPRAALVMVNAAMAYAQTGEKKQTEKFLRKAIKVAPDNAAAHFNLGLLKAEENQGKEAERELKEAFRLDPKMAPAAYNLCILSAKDRPKEALSWCKKAVELNPQEPKYAYTLAFYQKEQGDLKNAAATLQDILARQPGFVDGYLLLAEIYTQQGAPQEAEKLLRRVLQGENLLARERGRLEAALKNLTNLPTPKPGSPDKR